MSEPVKCPDCQRFLMESALKDGFAEVICHGCKARVRIDAKGARIIRRARRPPPKGVDSVGTNP